MLAEPLIANNAARDPAVEARCASSHCAHAARRVLAAFVLALVLLFSMLEELSLPVSILALGGIFVVTTELELILASRASNLRAFEAVSVAGRVVQLPVTVLALDALIGGGTWLTPIVLVLMLVMATNVVSGRALALLAMVAAVVNYWSPALFELALLPHGHFFELSERHEYTAVQRLAVSLIGLPMVAAFLHLRARQVQLAQGQLAEVVRELRLAQAELQTSQEHLQRWNRELNEEVERKTGALEERNRYLSIINAVSFALAEPMDDGGTLERGARLVARLLGVRAAQAYHRLGDSGDVTDLFVPMAPDDVHAPRLPEALLRAVAATGRPVTSDSADWVGPPALPDLGEPYAVVPLVAKGHVLGAFALVGTGSIRWGEQERHLLLLVGREMGVALENARLYREALSRAQRELFLSEFSRVLHEPRRDRTIQQALQLLAQQLEGSEVCFAEYPASGAGGSRRRPELVAHVTMAGGATSVARLVPSLAGLVRDRRDPLVLGEGGEAPLSEARVRQGIGTLAVAPLTAMRTVDRVVDRSEGALPDEGPVTQLEQVGVLVIAAPAGMRWDPQTTNLVRRVTRALAYRRETDALTSLQQQRIRELAALAEVARSMQSGGDAERLAVSFAQALASLLPYRRLYLARLSELGDLVSVTEFGAGGQPWRSRWFDAEDRAHEWFGYRRPHTWRAGEGDPPAFVEADEPGALVVPMRPKGQTLGLAVIAVDRRASPEQMHLVEQAVEQLALGLDNASLYQQATVRASHIQTLSNLARIVASAVDLREAFAAFAEEVRWLIPFDRSVMLLLDEDERVVQPYALYPDVDEVPESVPVEGSIASVVVNGVGAFSLSRGDERYADLDWSVFGSEAGEVAAVAVRQADRATAIFALVHAVEGAYAALDLAALEEVAGLLGVTIERLRLYQQAEHGARHDLLTGLPNYRYLQERLSELRPGISAPGESAVLLLDMDNLKLFNDTLGHEGGDRVIAAVAQELRTTCRAGDFVARTGGDEFTIVLEGSDAAAALGLAERLHAAVRDAHLEVPGAPIRIGLSIGIAVAPADGSTGADLLHAADLAMYEAKFEGGHRTRLSGDRSRESDQRSAPGRSYRVAETLIRSVLSAANPEERSATALAQRWVGAAVLPATGDEELVPVARMLVAAEVADRLEEQRDDREREMATFMIREVRDEWLDSADANRREIARVVVPAAVMLAWEHASSEAGGAELVAGLERAAAFSGADVTGALWQALAHAVSGDPDQRRRSAA